MTYVYNIESYYHPTKYHKIVRFYVISDIEESDDNLFATVDVSGKKMKMVFVSQIDLSYHNLFFDLSLCQEKYEKLQDNKFNEKKCNR